MRRLASERSSGVSPSDSLVSRLRSGLTPALSAYALTVSQTNERKTVMEKMSIETLYELKARMERRGRRDGVRYANCVRELRIRGLTCPLR